MPAGRAAARSARARGHEEGALLIGALLGPLGWLILWLRPRSVEAEARHQLARAERQAAVEAAKQTLLRDEAPPAPVADDHLEGDAEDQADFRRWLAEQKRGAEG